MSNNNNNNNNDDDDDDQYRDPQDKWSGFHFARLTCISVLILIIMIVALILDSLSVWGTIRNCSSLECGQDYCANGDCQGLDKDDCDACTASVQCCRYLYDCDDSGNNCAKQGFINTPSCEANGDCGWRTATTKWVNGGHPDCPTDDSLTIPVSFSNTFNYAELCDDGDDDACMAMNGGNTYLAFTIFAIIFNLFALCVIAPLYCRDRSLFPCEFCDNKTHFVLGFLYLLCVICNAIPIIVWLGLADAGMCDDADPYAQDAFDEPGVNYPGYSIGGLIICMIGHIVATCAVCCCWGDNRKYGDDRDRAKVERNKEKEQYRKEQEMQNQNQYNDNNQYNNNQGDNDDNATYSYN